MKKILSVILAIILVVFSISAVFAAEGSGEVAKESKVEYSDIVISGEKGNASSTTINNLTGKERQIQEYTEALKGNRTNGTVLYYLMLAQKYSFPVIFVLMVIASLNYFIIGNKKLEKRESGFKMLVTLIVGLIVFQILPLLFAIIVG